MEAYCLGDKAYVLCEKSGFQFWMRARGFKVEGLRVGGFEGTYKEA